MAQGLVDPLDPQDRPDVLLQHPHGLHAEPVLHQGRGLHQDIAGRQEAGSACHQAAPLGLRPRMLVVGGVQHRVQGGGVDEDGHPR